MTAQQAKKIVTKKYPRAKPSEGSYRICIISGRGTYWLSDWFDTADEAWLDAAMRLNKVKVKP